jgi:uncharacterized protein (DUF1778 family)
MNLYLITTSGSGEINIDLVEEDVWDFILNGQSSKYLNVVKEKYLSYTNKSFHLTDDDWEEVLDLVDDGNENDVALQVLFLAKHHFESIMSFATFIKENPSINIVDEWSGYIY